MPNDKNDPPAPPATPAKPTLPAPPLNPSGAMAAPRPAQPAGEPVEPTAPGTPPGRDNPAVSELVSTRLELAQLVKRRAADAETQPLRDRIAALEAHPATRALDPRSAGHAPRGGAYVARHVLVLGGPLRTGPNGQVLPGDRREIAADEAFDATPEELDGLVEGAHYTRA